jgi:hypothetical protein
LGWQAATARHIANADAAAAAGNLLIQRWQNIKYARTRMDIIKASQTSALSMQIEAAYTMPYPELAKEVW